MTEAFKYSQTLSPKLQANVPNPMRLASKGNRNCKSQDYGYTQQNNVSRELCDTGSALSIEAYFHQ